MSNELRLKIGQIEFEAKGDSETIERERIEFFNMLPQVVAAMSRAVYIQDTNAIPQLRDNNSSNLIDNTMIVDRKQMSINEFFNSKKFGNDVETILGTAYYIEEYVGIEEFTSNDIKEYMKKAKLKVPSNVTQGLNNNAGKGYIQDVGKGDKGLTKYSMTVTGIQFIEDYVSKVVSEKTKWVKPRKPNPQISDYQYLTREELNLDHYPKVKDLEKFKDKMVLAMYIVVNEKKGEYFTINDITCLLTNVFGEKANYEQVKGVFRRETDWFNKIMDKDNKKIIKYKMLNGSIDFAKELIDNLNE